MKLRIRGNSIRLGVSPTEVAQIAEKGKAEDIVRFSSERSLRYCIELRPTGAVTATFEGDSIVVLFDEVGYKTLSLDLVVEKALLEQVA